MEKRGIRRRKREGSKGGRDETTEEVERKGHGLIGY